MGAFSLIVVINLLNRSKMESLVYFLFTAGVIYDVIVEPPSIGQTTDPHTGHTKPVAFMPYRINGQYIMEGLAASFLFTMGGFGFIVLDQTNKPTTPKLNRFLMYAIAFVCIIISFFMCRVFMRMKLPGYMIG